MSLDMLEESFDDAETRFWDRIGFRDLTENEHAVPDVSGG